MSTSEGLCAQLSTARQRFLASVRDLSDAHSRIRPAGNEWSILEVLAHMIDVDDFYLGQAQLLRKQPGATFNYFDDDAWKRAHPLPNGFELEDVLMRLDASHQRVLIGARSMTDEELTRPGVHPRAIPYTVRDVFLRFPAHDQNHQRQIDEIRAQLRI
ncbi:MAG: DinB family protein [Dehalococcoidia bacterium]